MKEFTHECRYTLYAFDELPETDRQLVLAAQEATRRSYAPYSHFHVGAARRIAPTLALPFFVALFLQRFAPKANAFLCRYKGFSFYLWALALTITLGQTIDFMFLNGREEKDSILILGAASIFFCIVQFAVGKWLGSKYGDRVAGGQLLGQKNSAMGIWIANTYLLPLASVFPALYSIWQNLFNSWQLWRDARSSRA